MSPKFLHFSRKSRPSRQERLVLTCSLALATLIAAFALLVPSAAAALKLGPYIAPGATDNRGPCPAFNTMANHGVFPRDGSAIKRKRIVNAFRKFYSFSPTVTNALINGAMSKGVGDKKAGTIDLVQLRAHNKIEHDVSLVRDDAYLAVAFGEAAALAGVFGGRLRFYAVPIDYLKSFLRDQRYPKGFKPPLIPLSFPELLAVAARIKVAAFFA
ncbi:unnamed protein product [Closterium sp. Naga37s-1]|nr:unnamed protein product [Closterium sp. Naga37s-1]